MLLGTCRFMFVLIILSLLIALSMRTTPKGAGAFFGIPGRSFTKGREQLANSRIMCFLIILRLLPKGTVAFCGVSDSNLL